MAGNLTRVEAQRRAELLAVTSYEIDLDLTTGPDTFRSTTVMRFGCAEPGTETFCELADAEVLEVSLNGDAVDPGGYDAVQGRIPLTGLAPQNELRVVADCAYSQTGQGLHRFVDPVDGEVYLYSQCAPADAHRLFACFDQPDLKATFAVTVTAPDGWTVVANAAAGACEVVHGGRRWSFGATPPLSTYVVAVVAGPYTAWAEEYRGSGGQSVPLRVFCRASLADHLDAAEIFDVTRRGFDFYQDAFGLPYQFGKYDQLFVPETNLLAMENAGCVTFSEEYVFRSQVTDADHERRANTVLHELAHMWFGDLVTMRWWDDLWLNESFATYVATLAQVSCTRWTGAWTTFADSYKARAYRQDQRPSTHPVSADIRDVRSLEVNVDAITYQKGASVLRQLVAATGLDTFLAGLRTYFERHAWGSTTLTDLLDALAKASGRDLSAWSREWLETAGPNTLRPQYEVDADGRFTTFAVLQSAALADHPTLRTHRIAIGMHDGTPDGLVRRARLELDVAGERTEVADLVGVACPDLVLLNDDDLTYAKVRLDPRSLHTMLTAIGDVADPLSQAVCWTVAWDLARDAELAARDFVALVVEGLPSVRSATVVRTLLDQATQAAHRYTAPERRSRTLWSFADGLLALAGTAEPGGETQLACVQAFAAVASAPEHVDVAAQLLAGTGGPPGVTVGPDLRWALLRRLVVHGRAGEAEIAAELATDGTAGGQRNAVLCRAALATPEAKAAAWQRVVSGDLSNALLASTLDGFREPEHTALLAPYVEEYFTALTAVVSSWPSELTQVFASNAYPATVVTDDTVARTDDYLVTTELPGWARRLVVEGRDELARTLRAQAKDASGDAARSGSASARS